MGIPVMRTGVAKPPVGSVSQTPFPKKPLSTACAVVKKGDRVDRLLAGLKGSFGQWDFIPLKSLWQKTHTVPLFLPDPSMSL